MINFERVATAEVLEIVSIVEDLRNTSSTNAKREILENNKNNEGLQMILELTYNPFKKYKITEKTFKETTANGDLHDNLNILTYLLSVNNINDELRGSAINFINNTDEQIRDLYKCVLLKDLKIGVNSSTINKVWKGLIPNSETGVDIKPMLASKFDFEKPPKGEFAVTEKLDGIRCLAICTEEKIELYSRQGKLIEGCVDIEVDLRKLREYVDADFVLDGELLATGCTYEDVYKETTKRVKNKNVIKTGIEYKVFDIIEFEEFCNKKCTMTYGERMETLLEYNREIISYELDNISIIQVLYVGDDTNRLMHLLDEYRLKGAEGLMVNLMDAFYEYKRSKTILKVKVMETVDLRIIGFEEGQGRNEGKLGALLVDFKGNTVGVGSGFSDFDREYIWNNQDQYLGKIVEVQYFEITKDKTGTESLRFPVFKNMRLDKTEPSYF